MKALRYVEVPNYSALFLRRTFGELQQAKAPLDLATRWLSGTDARFDRQNHKFIFPNGSTLEFGHCNDANDYFKYLGGAWQTIVFDEMTMFTEPQFEEIVTRNTRTLDIPVPLQVIGTTNPGGPFPDWVYDRFLNPDTKRPDHFDVRFEIRDNPSVTEAEIEEVLKGVNPIRREQLLRGDWLIVPEGVFCNPDDFKYTEAVPPFVRFFRGWDIALTPGGDYTVGVLMARAGQNFYVLDVKRERLESPSVKNLILQTAESDPKGTVVGIESSTASYSIVQDLKLNEKFKVFEDSSSVKEKELRIPLHEKRLPLVAVKVAGKGKLERASGFLARIADGQVILKQGEWNRDYVREFTLFTNSPSDTDDQIDATSIAFHLAMRTAGSVLESTEVPMYSDEWFARLTKSSPPQQEPGSWDR